MTSEVAANDCNCYLWQCGLVVLLRNQSLGSFSHAILRIQVIELKHVWINLT